MPEEILYEMKRPAGAARDIGLKGKQGGGRREVTSERRRRSLTELEKRIPLSADHED